MRTRIVIGLRRRRACAVASADDPVFRAQPLSEPGQQRGVQRARWPKLAVGRWPEPRSLARLASPRGSAALLVLGLIAVALLVRLWPEHQPDAMMLERFSGRDMLITNEFADHNPQDPHRHESPVWVVTSGSLFQHDGAGWTGYPDDLAPDAGSRGATGSAVLRLVTRRRSFGDVAVSFRLRVERFVETERTPAIPRDGVHVFVRYQSPYRLYVISVARRDGAVVVKKKLPDGPSNNGRYVAIGRYVPYTTQIGSWSRVEVDTENVPHGVAFRVLVDGQLVTRAVDRGIGGPPIRAPGGVGLRGDNVQFSFDDFRVERLRPGALLATR
jgi:hypothetical protein